MKIALAPSLFVAIASVAGAAWADDKSACLDAASKGQRFRDVHQLVEAREQLRICAAARCPVVVQSDCAIWLADVEKALPGVVLTAKNRAGVDLVDVKVTIDGQPLVAKLDGQAVSINAGPHVFHFEGSDGSSVLQRVLVKEGDKSQSVAVVLGEVAQHAADGGAASLAASAPMASDGTSMPSSSGTSSGWKTAGWVIAVTGLAGLGAGGVFGFLAIGDKNDAHCTASGACDPGTTSGIRSAALLSDVGWIAGGTLLATGIALVWWGPTASARAASSVRVAPMVAAGGGGIRAEGVF